MSLTPAMMSKERMLQVIGELEAEVEGLKGVLEEIKRLSRLEDSVRMSAINQLTDKALEAKP